MNYPNIIFVLMIIFLSIGVASADNYYDQKKEALDTKEYIKPSKYLFACKVIKKKILVKNEFKPFAEELNRGIKKA